MHTLLFFFYSTILENALFDTFCRCTISISIAIHNDHWHDGDIDVYIHVSFQLASSLAGHRIKYGLHIE